MQILQNAMLQNDAAAVTGKRTLAAQKAVLAMCPPDFFDVTYQINPWMNVEAWGAQRDTWRKTAHAEWRALKETYERLGHHVHVITPAQGQPDMVFMANCAAVLDGKAVLAQFRHPERQGEEAHYKRFFNDLRSAGVIHDVAQLPAGMAFEGCGDAVWDAHRDMFWVGYSQRTDKAAPRHVASALDIPVVALEMVSSRFYHLDVALAPLSRGHVIYVPDAFSAEGRDEVRARVGDTLLIEATQEDADGFAVNLVNIGNDVILSYASPSLKAALETAGYTLHFVSTAAFQLAGGSVFCLTQRLDHRRA